MEKTFTYLTALETVTAYRRILGGLTALDTLVREAKTSDPKVAALVLPFSEDARQRAEALLAHLR